MSWIVRVAMVCVLALTAGACSSETEPSGDEPTTAGSTDTPETGTDPDAASGSADARFAALLEEHRRVDHDPGDEPSDAEAYALLHAEHAADLSTCGAKPATRSGSCPKPSSMSQELREEVNIQILLDSSGSMADRAAGGTKMEVARRVLGGFLDDLPAGANVSLRRFGHRGSGSGEDKAMSCRSTSATRFVAPDSPVLRDGLAQARPAGWTPLAGALAASRRDFERVGEASNFVYVVSDGIETCGGDPVAQARALSSAGVGVDVNVVGFDVDRQAARQLRAVAKASGGSYSDAGDAAELGAAFRDYDWAAWTDWYNCAFGKAVDDYNARVGAAIDNRNCVVGRAVDERNAITGAAIDQRNATTGAAMDEYNAIVAAAADMAGPASVLDAVRQRALDRRDALVERAGEIADHVVATAAARAESLIAATTSRSERQLARALRQRDAVMAEAERLRDRAAG